MSSYNTPTVILGKIFDESDIQDDLMGDLLDGITDTSLDCQSGSANYKRPCVGFVLGSMGRYDEDIDIVLMEQWEWSAKVSLIISQLESIGLNATESEIKLYMRDNWS